MSTLLIIHVFELKLISNDLINKFESRFETQNHCVYSSAGRSCVDLNDEGWRRLGPDPSCTYLND